MVSLIGYFKNECIWRGYDVCCFIKRSEIKSYNGLFCRK